jgi:polynucleotide 5'-hydroxyl-kinase GRC3/NOL9
VLAEWEVAARRAAQAPVTVVIGESDTGKTTLVTALANALQARGATVGVVDADLGQSEIGPPTTIGLGRVARPLARLGDAEPVALHFVGVTSPAGNMLGTLVGTHRMLGRARRLACERVVVDTSGLVSGDLGRTLKQAKIELLDPDLVISLERAGECEAIVRPYLVIERPAVLRLPVASAVRRRTADERRRHRMERLQAYFATARPVRLDLRQVILRQPPLFLGRQIDAERLAAAADAAGCRLPWGEEWPGAVVVVSDRPLGMAEAREVARSLAGGSLVHYALEELEMALAGLGDASGNTLGLGRVRGIDFVERALAVDTSVDPKAVVSVTVGRQTYPEPATEPPGLVH